LRAENARHATLAAIGWLTRQLAPSRELGFPGLRIAVDMSWALRPVTGIEQLPQFEEGIAAALAGTTASVLCQYDRDRFDPVTLASVAAFHTRSVAAATYHAEGGAPEGRAKERAQPPPSWTALTISRMTEMTR